MTRITVVLPNYNSDRHLEACIDAFLSQDHADKRLLVVDGKSTDGSHAILQRVAEAEESVVWIREADKGISDAINIALGRMEDDGIFGFLGADDILQPGTLSLVAAKLAAHPDWDGLYFDSYSQNAAGDRRLRTCPAPTMTLPALLRYRTIAGLQNFYLRAGLAKAYGFNTAARYSMDYELYLRLARDGHGARIHHVAHPSTVNINDGNISTTYRRASKREALKFAYAMAPPGWRKLRIGLRLLR